MDILNEYYRRLLHKEMAFSETEYNRRLAKVRLVMADWGLDVLLLHHLANICYLTGYQTPMSNWYNCLLVPAEGELSLQVCDFEVGLALVNTAVPNILNVRWNQMDEAAEQLVQLIRDQGFEKKRIGLEMRRPGLDPYTYEQLRKEFPNADFQDASYLVPKVRAIKSPAEIECMRQAAKYTVAGMKAAIAAIKPGVSDNEIAAAASEAMIKAGSEFFCTDPFVRAGLRSGIIHATFGRNLVKPGDPIIIEIGGVHQRYTAPLYRTAVLGEPSLRLKLLSESALRTLETLYENIRPGRTVDEVARAAAKELKTVDPEVYLSNYHAYPVGLGFPPEWSEHSVWIEEGATDVLQPGMTFHGVRSLRIPGLMAAGFSETITVTKTGCEILTHFPRELIKV
jgi:Xaa-Pro aminopeptidase